MGNQPSDHQPEESAFRYQMKWESKKAPVHLETHLNFIEAQPQVLSRKKQTKVIVGIVTAIAISAVVWLAIATLII